MRRGLLVCIATGLAWTLLCAAVRADENYVHTFTGFTFPPKVAAFTRARITPYNAEKSDIEVDYDNNPYTVHASVYVYPAHDPLAQHYMKCKSDVFQVHPDATILSEKDVSLTEGGVKYDGFSALFQFRDRFVNSTPQDLLSLLWVFRRGDYYVLYRISYAKSDKESAEREIGDFIKRLDWPAGNPPPASP
jgi:hypothetical protein